MFQMKKFHNEDEEEDANDELDAISSRYSPVPILFVAPTVEQVLQCTYVTKQEVLQHKVFFRK